MLARRRDDAHPARRNLAKPILPADLHEQPVASSLQQLTARGKGPGFSDRSAAVYAVGV